MYFYMWLLFVLLWQSFCSVLPCVVLCVCHDFVSLCYVLLCFCWVFVYVQVIVMFVLCFAMSCYAFVMFCYMFVMFCYTMILQCFCYDLPCVAMLSYVFTMFLQNWNGRTFSARNSDPISGLSVICFFPHPFGKVLFLLYLSRSFSFFLPPPLSSCLLRLLGDLFARESII